VSFGPELKKLCYQFVTFLRAVTYTPKRVMVHSRKVDDIV